MFEVRQYQQDAKSNLTKLANAGDFNSILAVGVGGGKTTMSLDFFNDVRVKQNYKVLWLASSNYLIDQAVDKLKEITPFAKFAKVVAGKKVDNSLQGATYVFMTYQYASRHLDELESLYKGTDLQVCIDECHHSCAKSYIEIISRLKGVVNKFSILGLTATPFRTKEEETKLLGNIFNVGIKDGQVSHDTGIAYKVSIADLIRDNYLATPIWCCNDWQRLPVFIPYEELSFFTKIEVEIRGELSYDSWQKYPLVCVRGTCFKPCAKKSDIRPYCFRKIPCTNNRPDWNCWSAKYPEFNDFLFSVVDFINCCPDTDCFIIMFEFTPNSFGKDLAFDYMTIAVLIKGSKMTFVNNPDEAKKLYVEYNTRYPTEDRQIEEAISCPEENFYFKF